jgi:hypothetical protein
MKLSFEDNESFIEATGLGSLRFNNPPSDPNTITHQQVESSSAPAQERSEDICFNNDPSNDLRMPVESQEEE